MYHGDAKETISPAPWLVPLPSLRRGIPATPKTACAHGAARRKEGRSRSLYSRGLRPEITQPRIPAMGVVPIVRCPEARD